MQRIRALFQKSTTHTTSVDVNAVIEDTISLVHQASASDNIFLAHRTGRSMFLRCARDRVQLQQVILNLVMNAIESTASIDRESEAAA